MTNNLLLHDTIPNAGDVPVRVGANVGPVIIGPTVLPDRLVPRYVERPVITMKYLTQTPVGMHTADCCVEHVNTVIDQPFVHGPGCVCTYQAITDDEFHKTRLAPSRLSRFVFDTERGPMTLDLIAFNYAEAMHMVEAVEKALADLHIKLNQPRMAYGVTEPAPTTVL